MISALVLCLLAVERIGIMAKIPTEMDWLDGWLEEPTRDNWRSEALEDGTIVITGV